MYQTTKGELENIIHTVSDLSTKRRYNTEKVCELPFPLPTTPYTKRFDVMVGSFIGHVKKLKSIEDRILEIKKASLVFLAYPLEKQDAQLLKLPSTHVELMHMALGGVCGDQEFYQLLASIKAMHDPIKHPLYSLLQEQAYIHGFELGIDKRAGAVVLRAFQDPAQSVVEIIQAYILKHLALLKKIQDSTDIYPNILSKAIYKQIRNCTDISVFSFLTHALVRFSPIPIASSISTLENTCDKPAQLAAECIVALFLVGEKLKGTTFFEWCKEYVLGLPFGGYNEDFYHWGIFYVNECIKTLEECLSKDDGEDLTIIASMIEISAGYGIISHIISDSLQVWKKIHNKSISSGIILKIVAMVDAVKTMEQRIAQKRERLTKDLSLEGQAR